MHGCLASSRYATTRKRSPNPTRLNPKMMA